MRQSRWCCRRFYVKISEELYSGFDRSVLPPKQEKNERSSSTAPHLTALGSLCALFPAGSIGEGAFFLLKLNSTVGSAHASSVVSEGNL